MNIQKLVFSFRSGFITQLESDTFLGYIFANNFTQLQHIFSDFKRNNPPFLITNGFPSGFLPRPVLFFDQDDENEEKCENETQLGSEMLLGINKKNIKRTLRLPIDSETFDLAFKKKNIAERAIYNNKLLSAKNENYSKKYIDFKNHVPRFHNYETMPFALPEIIYSDNSWTIYVKIFDEEKFQKFLEAIINTLTIIGRGAKKSVGYGKIKDITCIEIDEKEKLVFDSIEKNRKKGQYYVLNNYKPNSTEFSNINFENSNLLYCHKHAKIFPIGVGEKIFKGKYSFITPGSVVEFKDSFQSKGKILGNNYQYGDSFNFGYLW